MPTERRRRSDNESSAPASIERADQFQAICRRDYEIYQRQCAEGAGRNVDAAWIQAERELQERT